MPVSGLSPSLGLRICPQVNFFLSYTVPEIFRVFFCKFNISLIKQISSQNYLSCSTDRSFRQSPKAQKACNTVHSMHCAHCTFGPTKRIAEPELFTPDFRSQSLHSDKTKWHAVVVICHALKGSQEVSCNLPAGTMQFYSLWVLHLTTFSPVIKGLLKCVSGLGSFVLNPQ